MYYPRLANIQAAVKRISAVCNPTPLQFNQELSTRHHANIFMKREDLGPVRSYKLRGAYNKISSLTTRHVVTCSAGNHAQGVAYSCSALNVVGDVFMPTITTKQKIQKVKQFGGKNVNVFLEGDTLSESFKYANAHAAAKSLDFVHPFDDEKVIEGQATVGVEIMQQMAHTPIDYVFLPVGGGGLAAGVSSYIKEVSPNTKVIGVEPMGAPSMYAAFKANQVVNLEKIDTFVDGASIQQVGGLNFPICKKNLDEMVLIHEGHVCSKMIQMYNENGYIIEPAGVLSLCALDFYPGIKGANIVTIISGGNSDVFRMPEILEKSLVYEGLKHYFKIDFAQRPGSLKNFILKSLGPTDDIIYFRYSRAISKETAPVVIGLQVRSRDDIHRIMKSMNDAGFTYKKLENLSEE
jgi:threonine dehydratase